MRKRLLYLALFIIIAPTAWAAYPNYTVCASGCDFTTIALAFADISTNHPAATTPATITCTDASIETATITLIGVSANPLTITTSGSGKNNGQLSGYTIKPTTGRGIGIQEDHVVINGLAFDMTTSGSDGIDMLAGNHSDVTVINNYFKLTSGGGVGVTSASGNIFLYNNICFGNKSAAFNECLGFTGASLSNGTTAIMYSNTSYGMGRGFDTDNSTNATVHITFSNNFAGNTVNESVYRAVRAFAGSNNICGDSSSCTTAPLTSGTNNATSYTSYFTSPSTGDFTLKAGSILLDAGATLGSPYNVDIIGTSRPQGSAYDVGAFEAVQAPSLNTTIGSSTIGGNSLSNPTVIN